MEVVTSLMRFALLHYDQLIEENVKKSSFNLKFLKELLSLDKVFNVISIPIPLNQNLKTGTSGIWVRDHLISCNIGVELGLLAPFIMSIIYLVFY